MAFFTVRIELPQAIAADYQRLDAAMQTAGYRREVVGSDGVVFRLPTAEYDLQAVATADQVMEHAYQAAASVKPQPEPQVMVTQASYRAWSLPVVQRPTK